MKKYFIVVALFVVIASGYYFKNKVGVSTTTAAKIHQPTNNTADDQAKLEIEKSFEAATPKAKMPAYESMSESELIQEVHNMTHQKVFADQKWGFSLITKDKVEKLYTVVKNKEFKDNKAKEMLLEILKPWLQGDFSNAVNAHNEIWAYQHGTIGKATRLLTATEEEEYIKQKM